MLTSEGKADETDFLEQVALHLAKPEEGERGISGRESRGRKWNELRRRVYSWNIGDLSGVDSGEGDAGEV